MRPVPEEPGTSRDFHSLQFHFEDLVVKIGKNGFLDSWDDWTFCGKYGHVVLSLSEVFIKEKRPFE